PEMPDVRSLILESVLIDVHACIGRASCVRIGYDDVIVSRGIRLKGKSCLTVRPLCNTCAALHRSRNRELTALRRRIRCLRERKLTAACGCILNEVDLQIELCDVDVVLYNVRLPIEPRRKRHRVYTAALINMIGTPQTGSCLIAEVPREAICRRIYFREEAHR